MTALKTFIKMNKKKNQIAKISNIFSQYKL